MNEVKNNEDKYNTKKILAGILVLLGAFYSGYLYGQYRGSTSVINRAADVIDRVAGNLDGAIDAMRKTDTELENIRAEISGAGADTEAAAGKAAELREAIGSDVETTERIRANNQRAKRIVEELINGNKGGKSSSKETND